ncbi:MAG: DUF928 domain-containing protein [Cyanobacteria bacterium SBLK]|nr:DUF928 domain-containing protein [Cyanobacteria bacterium SBLK]
MNKKQFSLPKYAFCLALHVGVMNFDSLALSKILPSIQPGFDPSTRQFTQNRLLISTNEDNGFNGTGGGSTTQGAGASRNPECESVSLPLVALIPRNSDLHKTTAERPTIWFYIPSTPQQTPVGEFVLQDENEDDVFIVQFALDRTPGFVSFTIPSSQKALDINTKYLWFFNLYCDREASNSPFSVQGWIERIEMDTVEKNRLHTTSSLEDIEKAAKHNWYDTINQLVNLRANNLGNTTLGDTWTNFWINILNNEDTEDVFIDPSENIAPEENRYLINNKIKILSQSSILGNIVLENHNPSN